MSEIKEKELPNGSDIKSLRAIDGDGLSIQVPLSEAAEQLGVGVKAAVVDQKLTQHDTTGNHVSAVDRTSWNAKETIPGAQAKADAAMASAKTYAEAQAAAVDTKLTAHNTDSTRHITADERASWKAKETTTGAQAKADAALASAKSHADNIQIGGRNLALGTALIRPFVVTMATPGAQLTQPGLFVNLKLGQWYVVSFDACAETVDNVLHVEFNGSRGGNVAISGSEFSRYSVRSCFYADSVLYFWLPKGADSGNIVIRNIKIETGDKATDWSPAPEDLQLGVENLINNSMSTIPWTGNSGKYQIANWLQESDYIIKGETYTIVAELYVDAGVSGNGIGFWINSDRMCGDQFFKPLTPTVVVTTFVAGISGYLCAFHFPKWSPGNSYINWVKLVKGNKASLEHSYSVAYDHAPLGGVNLLNQTELFDFKTVIDLTTSLEIGQQYTLSIGRSTSTSGNNTSMLLANIDGPENIISMYLDFGVNKRITFVAEHKKLTLYAGPLWSSGNSAKIERLKLEKGNRATDWSQSPNDVQTLIEAKPDHVLNHLGNKSFPGVIWRTMNDVERSVIMVTYQGTTYTMDSLLVLRNNVDFFNVELGCVKDKNGVIRQCGDGWNIRVDRDGRLVLYVLDVTCVGCPFKVNIKFINR